MSRAAASAAIVFDRVDHTLRVLRRRADEQDRVVVDRSLHRGDVGTPVGADRNAPALQPEVLAALLERGVRRGGQHHVRLGDAALGAAPFACRLHRQQDALGAAGRHEAGSLLAGLQPLADHRHDLGLDGPQARERIGVQRVLRRVAAVGLLGDGQHVGTGVVDERERPPVAPAHVVSLELVEVGEDRLRRHAGIGKGHGPKVAARPAAWRWRPRRSR